MTSGADLQHLSIEEPVEGVALITMSRPEVRNAMSMALHRQLGSALRQVEADGAVRAVVLTGADGVFSAGYDVVEMQDWDEDQLLLSYVERDAIMWQLAACTKPTVAAVAGYAYGGGAVTAMACDLRIGGPNTTFKVTAATYGGVNASWVLPLIAGMPRAKEWLLTGRAVGAAEALAGGLLNSLVEDGRVVEVAVTRAAEIAANPAPATQAIKALINEHVGRAYGDAQRAETQVMTTSLRPGRVRDLFAGFLTNRS